MMTNKRDWSAAPKDAQFYSYGAFRKQDEHGNEFYYSGKNWRNAQWSENMNVHKGCFDFEMRQEPPKWNGQGLPPVGMIVEYSPLFEDGRTGIEYGQWYQGKIIAYHDGCVWTSDNGIRLLSNTRFRPIKSDREKWIDKASGSVIRALGIPGNTEILGIIYDAGLAKLP